MKSNSDIQVVIIGDSTNNTLSAVRSLGEARIPQYLILVAEDDHCFVAKSRYLKGRVTKISDIEQSMPLLDEIAKANPNVKPYLICTFDAAAVWVDNNESLLSRHFITPCRGRSLSSLFDKDVQCRLAERCGLTVPRSATYSRKEPLDVINIGFPLILKPGNSTKGEKGDIHICRSKDDIVKALEHESHCERFVVQEFVEKEYELDCIGVRTDAGTIIAGAVRKIRHYPPLIGAGAYGLFVPIEELDIDVDGVDRFLQEAGYYGPFSVEFLHAGDKNYFMEVNFRNEGLAYAATAAGANLHAKYVNPDWPIDKVKPTYMMNYSLDYLYVKNGEVSRREWWRDFFRTRAFININLRDLGPTIAYYRSKVISRISKTQKIKCIGLNVF